MRRRTPNARMAARPAQPALPIAAGIPLRRCIGNAHDRDGLFAAGRVAGDACCSSVGGACSSGGFEYARVRSTYRHREHPRRARVAECIRIVRVGDMRGRGVRVCFRHFFDVRGRDMRVRNGQAQAACFAGECVHGRVLATNISSARVFVTPVRVDRPRQKRPLRRHASASGITFVAHVEVRAVAIRQSRRAPRFAAAHALASCDPRRARPWPHAGNMLVRGMRVATCACARCVFPQAMHVSAARAAITTPAALRAKRHASRTSNAPVGCPDSLRLYSARIKSTRIEPAAHAAGSRRSSIPHHSPHASATAPRIAPPAAVNPHRNCGDTRPDSSPRCA